MLFFDQLRDKVLTVVTCELGNTQSCISRQHRMKPLRHWLGKTPWIAILQEKQYQTEQVQTEMGERIPTESTAPKISSKVFTT